MNDYRRTQCRNNLKQIGIALHNYHDTVRVFPPAGISTTANAGVCADYSPDDDIDGNTRGLVSNYLAQLLPYMDQGPLYSTINFNANWMTTNNSAWSKFIPAFVCPSDPNASSGNMFSGGNSNNATMQRGNYAACGGNSGGSQGFYAAFWVTPWSQQPSDFRGLMGPAAAANLRDVTDGSSNSVAVIEIRVAPTAADVRGIWAYAPGATSFGPGGINNGTDWFQYCADQTPTGMPCNNGGGVGGNTSGDQRHVARSMHTGGCHAVFADGAVRFLSQNMDSQVFDNLRCISDGKVVGTY